MKEESTEIQITIILRNLSALKVTQMLVRCDFTNPKDNTKKNTVEVCKEKKTNLLHRNMQIRLRRKAGKKRQSLGIGKK